MPGEAVISMTGFGRSAREAQGLSVQVEIKSFNQRFLKIVARLPNELSFLEEDIRKRIARSVSRGQVEVTVRLSGNMPSGVYCLNREALRRHYKEWVEANNELGIEGPAPVLALLAVPDVWVEVLPDDAGKAALDKVAEMVANAVDAALLEMDGMRRREGEATREDLLDIGRSISGIAERIERLWPEARMCAVERLRPIVAELLDCKDGTVPPGIEREVAQLADKSDISEELKRLQSHVEQYLSALLAGGAIGRKLEFLLQEMHREMNTIAAKSLDGRISAEVVEAKVLMERAREQVQNIE